MDFNSLDDIACARLMFARNLSTFESNLEYELAANLISFCIQNLLNCFLIIANWTNEAANKNQHFITESENFVCYAIYNLSVIIFVIGGDTICARRNQLHFALKPKRDEIVRNITARDSVEACSCAHKHNIHRKFVCAHSLHTAPYGMGSSISQFLYTIT